MSAVAFASPRIAQEWFDGRLDPTLKEIVAEAAEYALERWNWKFYLTCIYRTPQEDKELGGSGIHVAWRAADARTRDQPKIAVDDVVKWINDRWVYDRQRPTMVVCYAKPHGTGPHAHFQCCFATKRIGKKEETNA